MGPTADAEANALLRVAADGLRAVFGDALAGLYLYGSAAVGDYDPARSDLDLLAACAGPVEPRLPEIDALHRALVSRCPTFEDRIDLLVAPLEALRAPWSSAHALAFVSPGEPLHLRTSGEHWVVNLYVARERGLALHGPPAHELIAPIPEADFVASVRAHLLGWRSWIRESDRPGFQAYAVLTICRALHACRTGAQASKPEAARWAARAYPEWAALIDDALARREVRGAASFVDFALRESRAV